MKNRYLETYNQQALRKCQMKELDILQEVSKICDRHGIDYWLDSGTLLGAVRHGGFIPWDDDIDIGMTEEGVKRFLEIAPKELPENLFVQTPQTDDIKTQIIKVRDLNSLIIERGDDFQENYQKGMFIDIFPFEDYPDISAGLTRKLAKGMSVTYAVTHSRRYITARNVLENVYFRLKYHTFKAIWKILKTVRGKKEWTGFIMPTSGFGNRHRISTIFPLTEIQFEGITFKAPHDTDQYLKDLYKNYMELPPEDKRIIHGVYYQPQLVEE